MAPFVGAEPVGGAGADQELRVTPRSSATVIMPCVAVLSMRPLMASVAGPQLRALACRH